MESEIRNRWEDTAKILNFQMRVVNEPLNTLSKENRPDGSSCLWGITGMNSIKGCVFLNFALPVRLVTKFRGTNEIGWKAYVKPFKGEMWAAVGLWLLLSTATVVIVKGCTKRTFYRNIFTAFYCMCPLETDPRKPAPLSTRLVYLTTLTVPAVIVPAYSAYILSTLSIVLPLKPFDDLKGLIADGTFKVSAPHNTFFLRYIQGSEDPEIKEINDHFFVGVDNAASDFDDLFEQICRTHRLTGLFVDTHGFRSRFKCKMFVVEQEVMSITIGFILQKDSPFRKIFNELFAFYHERGVLYKPSVMKKGGPFEVERFAEEAKRLNSLNMSQMHYIFFLIPLGVLFSGFVLVLEIAVSRKFQVSLKGIR